MELKGEIRAGNGTEKLSARIQNQLQTLDKRPGGKMERGQQIPEDATISLIIFLGLTVRHINKLLPRVFLEVTPLLCGLFSMAST